MKTDKRGVLRRCTIWLCGLIWAQWLPASPQIDAEPLATSWTVRLQDGLDSLLADELLERSQLGLCVYDLTDDTLLFAHQAKQRLRPASTEKVLTAVAALAELGPHHLFITRMCHTGTISDGILHGDLYIIGGFDPLFDATDLHAFVEALQRAGVDSVAGTLCADLSLKDTLQWGWGWCWDDDMPVLTPLPLEGKDTFMPRFEAALKAAGIGHGRTSRRRCPDDARPLSGRARPLTDVLAPMMKKSDNLCAEAVFYQLAARSGQPYATRKEALRPIDELIARLGLDPARYVVADGSGVSLYNYLSAELEVALLRHAWRDSLVFRPLYDSMPVAGTDGTLERRMKGSKAAGNVRAKTGTLAGVSTLAGYARATNGHLLAFSVMNQGVERVRAAQTFQDKVCELLCR